MALVVLELPFWVGGNCRPDSNPAAQVSKQRQMPLPSGSHLTIQLSLSDLPTSHRHSMDRGMGTRKTQAGVHSTTCYLYKSLPLLQPLWLYLHSQGCPFILVRNGQGKRASCTATQAVICPGGSNPELTGHCVPKVKGVQSWYQCQPHQTRRSGSLWYSQIPSGSPNESSEARVSHCSSAAVL